jgi:ligand-binding SRPBCC domain-containing protein
MALFEHFTDLSAEPGRVFDFLVNVHNMSLVMPAKPRFKILKAPPRLHIGARLTAMVYRFGISRTIVSEVTWFEEGVGFTDIMVRGPFAKFEHTHRVEAMPTGCRMSDRIEFEPPGGPLGLYLTEKRIRRELAVTFAHRDVRFRDLLR